MTTDKPLEENPELTKEKFHDLLKKAAQPVSKEPETSKKPDGGYTGKQTRRRKAGGTLGRRRGTSR